MRVIEMEARSALVKSGLGGVDYVVNPYTGCRFGCAYCYATFMSRYVSEPIEEWGEYVYVKRNIVERPELLEDLFARLAGAGVRRVYVEHLNAKGYIRKRLDAVVARQPELVRATYAEARTRENRARLEQIVSELIDRHGMELRLGAVIDHPENCLLYTSPSPRDRTRSRM